MHDVNIYLTPPLLDNYHILNTCNLDPTTCMYICQFISVQNKTNVTKKNKQFQAVWNFPLAYWWWEAHLFHRHPTLPLHPAVPCASLSAFVHHHWGHWCCMIYAGDPLVLSGPGEVDRSHENIISQVCQCR